MPELLTAVLIVILIPAAAYFFGWVGAAGSSPSSKTDPDAGSEPSVQPACETLDCRVRLTEQKDGNCDCKAFCVEICGTINAADDVHQAAARIAIADVTDVTSQAKPVRIKAQGRQAKNSDTLVFNADLGRLPCKVTTLSDWLAVGRIDIDALVFPRKGKRRLRFDVSILSRQSGREIACGKCSLNYENTQLGYIDLHENTHWTKTLAVALAFAVSAADDRLYRCEIEVITDWARNNAGPADSSKEAKRKLEKALKKTVAFFRRGGKIDAHKICTEIVEFAAPGQRYDILELCLKVAAANGSASAEELALLKDLAEWLEVDTERFRSMTERILPVTMHQAKDAEGVLGVTSGMSKDHTRRLLNKQYRKWNARTTSSDPQIQTQADCMLSFIAQARRQYIG